MAPHAAVTLHDDVYVPPDCRARYDAAPEAATPCAMYAEVRERAARLFENARGQPPPAAMRLRRFIVYDICIYFAIFEAFAPSTIYGAAQLYD